MDEQVKSAVAVFLLKAALLLAVLGSVAFLGYRAFAAKPHPTVKETIEVLRTEDLAFLVTSRVVTKVVVESRENDLLLGRREGYLIATTRLYFGVDLQQLTPEAVAVENGVIVVTVPEPRELDFAVDLNSIRFLSKRSGWIVVRDFLQDLDFRQELQKRVHEVTTEMIRQERLAPGRDDLVNRLNRIAPVLSGKCGTRVVFR